MVIIPAGEAGGIAPKLVVVAHSQGTVLAASQDMEESPAEVKGRRRKDAILTPVHGILEAGQDQVMYNKHSFYLTILFTGKISYWAHFVKLSFNFNFNFNITYISAPLCFTEMGLNLKHT